MQSSFVVIHRKHRLMDATNFSYLKSIGTARALNTIRRINEEIFGWMTWRLIDLTDLNAELIYMYNSRMTVLSYQMQLSDEM